MGIIIDFKSRVAEKRKNDVIESIPDRVYKNMFDIEMLPISQEAKIEKWDAFLVKEVLREYKFEDDFLDQMQYC